jgi:hypothetical protein
MRNVMTGLLVSLCVFGFAGISQANLLQDHFGVNLSLDSGRYDSYQKTTTYGFDLASLVPTKNTATLDYAIGDWYGAWSKTSATSNSTVWGKAPSGAEPYDVEAMYFDSDAENFYIAIVTSVNPVAGNIETRVSGSPTVVPGDLAISLSADKFTYDYGVNTSLETRKASGNATAGSSLGSSVYRTTASDWYLGTPNNAAAGNGELTNFDPNYPTFAGDFLANADVSYYEKVFPNGQLENGTQTYVLELTLNRSMFGSLDQGGKLALQYAPGCRNDVVRLTAEASQVPEPATMGLILTGLVAMLRRKW